MIDLLREKEICKPVLKLDFTVHGIMESPSEFGLGVFFFSKALTKSTVGACNKYSGRPFRLKFKVFKITCSKFSFFNT
jgi:hypothetical protein